MALDLTAAERAYNQAWAAARARIGRGATLAQIRSDPAVQQSATRLAEMRRLAATPAGQATRPDAPAVTPGSPPPPPPTPTAPSRSSAVTMLRDMFSQYGLDTLATVVDGLIKDPDVQDSQILLRIRESDAYKRRFPGMAELIKRGQFMDESTYIEQERSYRNVLAQYAPPGFYDSAEDFAGFITNGVAPTELERRLQSYRRIIDSSDPSLREAARTYYGLTDDLLLANLIDPARAQPLIDKQIRSIELGAAATRTGFDVTKDYAERIATDPFGSTLSTDQINAGFQQARLDADTQSRLANIDNESDFNENDSIDAILLGDTKKQLKSQARSMKEQARFSGSTAFRSGIGRGASI